MSSRSLHSKWVVLAVIALLVAVVVLTLPVSHEQRLQRTHELVDAWELDRAQAILVSMLQEKPGNISILRLYCRTLVARSELPRARSALESLIELDSTHQFSHHLDLAFIHFYLGHLDTASSMAADVAAHARVSEDNALLSRCHNLLGLIAFNKADYAAAKSHQERSLELARSAESPQAEADALRQLGVLCWYRGQGDSARTVCYKPALRLYRESNDRIGEATTLSDIGLLFLERNELLVNLQYQLSAFEIRRRIGDQRGLADSYYFLSHIPGRGKSAKTFAYTYAMRSLDLSRRIGYAWGQEVAARFLELDWRRLKESYRGRLSLKSVGDQDSITVLSGEGKFYALYLEAQRLISLGQLHHAVPLLKEFVEQSGSANYRMANISACGHYGKALMLAGDVAAAEDAFNEVLRKAATADRVPWIDDFAIDLAELYLRTNRPRMAIGILDPLTRRCDSLFMHRLTTSHPDVAFEFAAAMIHQLRSRSYALLVEMASRESPARLFEIMERERQLPFWGGTGDNGGSHASQAMNDFARLLESYDQHPEQFENISKLQTSLSELYTTLLAEERILAEVVSKEPQATIPTLTQMQGSLRANEVFVEYYVGNRAVVALVARQDTAAAMQLGIAPDDLKSIVEVHRATLMRGKDNPLDDLWKSSAYELFIGLIQPLVTNGLLREGDHLIIAPHGILHLLPFHSVTLTASDQDPIHLVERNVISYSPSGSLLVQGRGHTLRLPSTLLVLAASEDRLRHVREELDAIPDSMFGTVKKTVRADATADEVLRELGRHDVIHVATHAKMNPWHPLYSWISWSDRKIQLHEILRQRMNARLVVLSACETGVSLGGVGDIPASHDLVSFPRAFLSAGAAAVIGSLWIVEDEATALLMKPLYRNLTQPIQPSIAHSLNHAQREFLAAARSSGGKVHPFYWTAFYFTGTP